MQVPGGGRPLHERYVRTLFLQTVHGTISSCMIPCRDDNPARLTERVTVDSDPRTSFANDEALLGLGGLRP